MLDSDDKGKNFTFLDYPNKISLIMNDKSISKNEYIDFLNFFLEEENRQHIFEILEDKLEVCDEKEIVKILLTSLEASQDGFSKIVKNILSRPVEIETLALILEWVFISAIMQENIRCLQQMRRENIT